MDRCSETNRFAKEYKGFSNGKVVYLMNCTDDCNRVDSDQDDVETTPPPSSREDKKFTYKLINPAGEQLAFVCPLNVPETRKYTRANDNVDGIADECAADQETKEQQQRWMPFAFNGSSSIQGQQLFVDGDFSYCYHRCPEGEVFQNHSCTTRCRLLEGLED